MDEKPRSGNLKEIFHESENSGSPTDKIDGELMRSMTRSNPKLSQTEFEQIKADHRLFIDSGGLSGKWETVLVAGMVMGIYTFSKASEGKQADFYNKQLDLLNMKSSTLPASNFIASIGEGVDISNSNLEKSIFTDAFWKDANFENCKFKGTDFSRADLRGCNFRNCDLESCDFENCNLENADFRNANLKGSRFPGAKLSGIKYTV